MEVTLTKADGLPTKFAPRIFSKMEAKMSARIRKLPARKDPVKITKQGQQFYLDFGFMQASTDDYSRPDKGKDRIIRSYDGYSSYILIVEKIPPYVWIFLA